MSRTGCYYVTSVASHPCIEAINSTVTRKDPKDFLRVFFLMNKIVRAEMSDTTGVE
jgi:hypothetical protein